MDRGVWGQLVHLGQGERVFSFVLDPECIPELETGG